MPKRTDIHSILIIGSGPIVIGQACEFDYSGTQACRVLPSHRRWPRSRVRVGESVVEVAEASGLEVLDGLDELLAGVHHERSVGGDGFADRLAGHDE